MKTGGRLLYAPNVHQGGGQVLLLPLLEALKNDGDVYFVLDKRLKLPIEMELAGDVYWVKPSLVSRLWCEWKLCRLIKSEVLILSMANVPPLFFRHGIQKVFVQNRYLIEDRSLSFFSLQIRIRLMIERWWLRTRSSHVDSFIVQTPTMQRLIKNALGVNAKILPFSADMTSEILPYEEYKKKYDFIYVASGEPHKNHKNLVDAWIILAGKNLFPSLCLTLNIKEFPQLCNWISAVTKKYGLSISLIGECSNAEIQKLYQHSGAMVYPSLFESFGLPLIEATKVGLPILATDVSYVNDVIKPSNVFDPLSSKSIANSIQSFSNKPALLKIKLFSAEEFLMRIFNKDQVYKKP